MNYISMDFTATQFSSQDVDLMNAFYVVVSLKFYDLDIYLQSFNAIQMWELKNEKSLQNLRKITVQREQYVHINEVLPALYISSHVAAAF
uniref:Neur_chan_LBD domain-containing protein n=1 Tax=Heterorhabditis bacteriophora TaxID=37862 RepID=A0A1I7XNF0_HETBA